MEKLTKENVHEIMALVSEYGEACLELGHSSSDTLKDCLDNVGDRFGDIVKYLLSLR